MANPDYQLTGCYLLDTLVAESGRFLELARIGRAGQRIESLIKNTLLKDRPVYGVCRQLIAPDIVKSNYADGKGTIQLQRELDKLVSSLQIRDDNQLPDYIVIHHDYLLPKVGKPDIAEYEPIRGALTHIIINQIFEYIASALIDPDIYSAKKVSFFVFVEAGYYKNDKVIQLIDAKPATYLERMIGARAERLVKKRDEHRAVVDKIRGSIAADDPKFKEAESALEKLEYETNTFWKFMELAGDRNLSDEFFEFNIIKIPDHNISVDFDFVTEKIKAIHRERINPELP